MIICNLKFGIFAGLGTHVRSTFVNILYEMFANRFLVEKTFT